MKEKLIVGLCAVGLMALSALITAAAMESIDDSSALKREIMTVPPADWVERHGDSFESVQTYNIAILLDLERKRQVVK